MPAEEQWVKSEEWSLVYFFIVEDRKCPLLLKVFTILRAAGDFESQSEDPPEGCWVWEVEEIHTIGSLL